MDFSVAKAEQPEVTDLRIKAEALLDSPDPSGHVLGVNMLLEAVEKGSSIACHRLGVACAKAQGGLPRDETLAAELWTGAAKMGNAESCFALGCCYESGRGVPKDMHMALKCWSLAHKAGHKHASFMYPYAQGNIEDAAKDEGFIGFVMRNKKGKNKMIMEACLQLYAGVLRRRCLYS